MNAEKVRNVLEAYIKANDKDARIYHEKKISSSICDVMVVTDKLIGYEIKSDLDNYSRLTDQVEAYDLFFDFNYIVVGQTHLRGVSQKVPSHWGIICITENKLTVERKAQKHNGVSVSRQLSILWKIELKNLLIKNNLPTYALKTKSFIISRLADAVNGDTLKRQIADELKTRDYSLFDNDDDDEDFAPTELLDGLSEQDFSTLTLDKWIALYNRAKKLQTQKDSLFETRKSDRIEHKIKYTDISVSLGAPWVSRNIVNDFVWFLLDLKNVKIGYIKDYLRNHPNFVEREPITGNWHVDNKNGIAYRNKRANETYGIERYNALYIIEATLNLREIKLYDYSRYNEADTLAVLEKQGIIIAEFNKWIWQDEDRIWEVEEAYNTLFANMGATKYDGSKLTFAGMNDQITLRDYQKDAVKRIISTPNTLLAFDVGAGKTFIMVTAAMQMRKNGLSRKNMFVVPNNIVGQWEYMFTTLYPKARVLAVEPKSFKPEAREKILTQIKNGDYDGIIIAYSCFEMINLSSDFVMKTLQDQIFALDNAIKTLRKSWAWGDSALEREKEYLKKLADLMINSIKFNTNDITFDKLGINTLFVDEAHNFKNIPLRTALKNLRGINVNGSQKCLDMLNKVRCIQKQNGGRGAVFATGTPLCNSISDAYTMQLYLQYDILRARQLDRFDNWVKTFAIPEQVCEIDVDTSSFRFVRRFSKFINLPELSKLFAESTAFYANVESDLPVLNDYDDVVIKASNQLKDYMQSLSDRSEKVRAKEVDRSKDNMLKITTDGRKAALDLTLVGVYQPYDETCKTYRCVQNVTEIYNKFKGCAQLIFCDYSTPKGENFSVYRELKQRLVEQRIPAKEIAFVHTCKNEESRLKLYESVNEGKVRVLIGSTFKLGIGANVQTKLKAAHHLDVPWRPADMVQREGRILRRGNENKVVNIFRYISEGSFDAYSWQILETKQRFISQFLNGTTNIRTASDLENSVLSYAEVKALALSSPQMKLLAEKENELRNAKVLYLRECERKQKLQDSLPRLDEDIAAYEMQYVNSVKNELYVKNVALSKDVIKTACENITELSLFGEEEQTLCTIYGFDVVTQQEQSDKKPYVYLCREGVKYPLEMGYSVSGNATRMENFFTKITDRTNRIYEQLQELRQRKETSLRQISEPSKYAATVEKLQQERDGILEKLHVEEE